MFLEPGVQERMLHLVFGVDPATADRADLARREYERFDSRVRNLQWQASQTRSKLDDLREFLVDEAGSGHGDLSVIYDRLTAEQSAAEEEVGRKDAALRDARLRFADVSAKYASLQNDYEETFSQRSRGQQSLDQHPLVVESLRGDRCDLCGSAGADVKERLKGRVSAKNCPLCGSVKKSRRLAKTLLAKLKLIDSQLLELKEERDHELRAAERLEQDLGHLQERLEQATKAVEEFEAENKSFSLQRGAVTAGLADVAEAYRVQVGNLMDKKEQALSQRDEVRDELARLQRDMAARYSGAEAEFVPLFRDLAHAFLGLDIDVRMEVKRGKPGLVLQVENQERRLWHSMSESQRFFLDIALRMAIAQFIAADESPATLFIDTPEGSLDAAYESRAGELFAKFARNGNHIVMTANINTSQLLLKLASLCGTELMRLTKMTEWTDLSEVQLEQHQLFEDALSDIEGRLRGDEA